jgi:hypothetical protein
MPDIHILDVQQFLRNRWPRRRQVSRWQLETGEGLLELYHKLLRWGLLGGQKLTRKRESRPVYHLSGRETAVFLGRCPQA